jgi:hypothetical protein
MVYIVKIRYSISVLIHLVKYCHVTFIIIEIHTKLISYY